MELSEYKELLLGRYLRIIFKPFDAKDRNDIKLFEKLKKIVNFNGEITDVVSYADYEPSFFGSKNEYGNYALFTKDAFYGIDTNGRAVNSKYRDIEGMLETRTSLFGQKKNVIMCRHGRTFSINHKIAKVFDGFIVINETKNIKDRKFDEFLIGRTTKIFGEIVWGLSNYAERSIKSSHRGTPVEFILYRLKLKELTLSAAYFQITLKDTDIIDEDNPGGLFEEYEWENAIERYNSDSNLKTKFQISILASFGLYYDLKDIHFLVKCKTALSTRVNNAIYNVQDYMYRSVESAQRNCKK